MECNSQNLSAYPSYLLLQWHITDKCNLRCQHCYQEQYRDSGPEFYQLLDILDQFEMLLSVLSEGRKRVTGHINITGGEPFVRQDFLQLLTEIHRRGISFAILSNGLMIDRATARFVKSLKPGFIQLSLEGGQHSHDAIRGQGNFQQVLNSLQVLKKAGIRTLVSFTAQRQNYRDFPEVAAACKRHGVSKLWSDRLIPMSASDGIGEVLSPHETQEFFNIMSRQDGKKWGKRTVAMHRALQFLVSGGKPYQCSAGHSLVTVMPDGSVFPCRRLPISAGNLFDTTLTRIYFDSELFKNLRDPSQSCAGCEDCSQQSRCRGGLRCLAYALTGDPFQADPGCWLAKRDNG